MSKIKLSIESKNSFNPSFISSVVFNQFLYSLSYDFSGIINIDYFKKSVFTVLANVDSFNYRSIKNNNVYGWVFYDIKNHLEDHFLVIKSEDVNLSVQDICKNQNNIKHLPIKIIVVVSENEKKFSIIQINNHGYLDGRSTVLIFNKIVERYNLLSTGKIENSDDSHLFIKTAELDHINKIVFKKSVFFSGQHWVNLIRVLFKRRYDLGLYSNNMKRLMERLPDQEIGVVGTNSVAKLAYKKVINKYKQIDPKLTISSIVSAMLVKALYNVNSKHKNITKAEFSFAITSNILPKEMQNQYIGNNISSIFIAIDCDNSIANIARSIDHIVKKSKSTKEDASIFNIFERMVKNFTDKSSRNYFNSAQHSFDISNLTNHNFLKTKDFFYNCQALYQDAYLESYYDRNDLSSLIILSKPLLYIIPSPNGILSINMLSILDEETICQIKDEINLIFRAEEKDADDQINL